MRSRASQRGKDRKRDPRDKWGIMKRRRGEWGMEGHWVNRPEKTGGFYKGNNKRLSVKSQIFVRSEVKTLWVCFIISHQVLISCTIDNSWSCVWSRELSVQASSALRPPFQPFISMLIKAFENLFAWRRPRALPLNPSLSPLSCSPPPTPRSPAPRLSYYGP